MPITTSIRKQIISLPMAGLGRPSNMPRFRWQQPMPNRKTPPNFGLSEEESLYGFNWGEDSILPYQVSDDYDRELTPGTLEVVVIDNGRLRAVVAPSLGGRLLELKDLEAERDLVFRNPVFQPANLAALNAWFSGGIEWNGLIPGHTPFTCAPVFAGLRETPEGDVDPIGSRARIVQQLLLIVIQCTERTLQQDLQRQPYLIELSDRIADRTGEHRRLLVKPCRRRRVQPRREREVRNEEEEIEAEEGKSHDREAERAATGRAGGENDEQVHQRDVRLVERAADGVHRDGRGRQHGERDDPTHDRALPRCPRESEGTPQLAHPSPSGSKR